MQGVVFLGNRELELREFPDPTPGEREVIVEIKASGMCGSDLMYYRATGSVLPIVRGHEPCGVVVARGSGVTEAEAPIGQRVMIHHYSGCGACKYCKVGYAQLCVKGGHKVYGSTADGGHAPYIKVLPYMLVPLDDALSFAEGASISCGTGTAYDALKRLNVSGRDTLAVYGQGPVGLSATMLGVAMGARVIAIDPSEARRQMATEFGADLVIDPAAGDPVAQVKEATHGEGASTTLDATGIPEPRQNTIKSASMWGRACLVGEGGDTTFSVSADIIHKQLTIHGSWTFSSIGQAECARFVLDHKLPLSRLLTHEFSLDQAEAAYKLFDTQKTGKGVFVRN